MESLVPDVIRHILSYLEPEDLCVLVHVRPFSEYALSDPSRHRFGRAYELLLYSPTRHSLQLLRWAILQNYCDLSCVVSNALYANRPDLVDELLKRGETFQFAADAEVYEFYRQHRDDVLFYESDEDRGQFYGFVDHRWTAISIETQHPLISGYLDCLSIAVLRKLLRSTAKFDARRVLVFSNGVFDFETDSFRPGRPSDMARNSTRLRYARPCEEDEKAVDRWLEQTFVEPRAFLFALRSVLSSWSSPCCVIAAKREDVKPLVASIWALLGSYALERYLVTEEPAPFREKEDVLLLTRIPSIFLSVSRDNGETWSEPRAAAGPPLPKRAILLTEDPTFQPGLALRAKECTALPCRLAPALLWNVLNCQRTALQLIAI